MISLSEEATRQSDVKSDINVTPLADVMLVLLIIFLVITPMLSRGIWIDLPIAKNPHELKDAARDDAITISISRDGRLFIGAYEVKRDQIADKVRDLLKRKMGDKTVFVKCDRRAKYGDIAAVVDVVRTIGVDTLGLITERKMVQGGATTVSQPSTGR
ncbi:MAG: biopolymer transporter ExbD [Acidobacteriia bacterium]|nr:biopolymer transporter ExbD [Terriglobia bacterium]